MKPSPQKVIALAALLGLAAGAYPVAAHHATSMFAMPRPLRWSAR